MNKNKQEQNAGNNSTNIQVDGNITIVLTYSDVRQIAEDIFNTNFLKLQGEAQNIAQLRAEELISNFLTKLQNESHTELEVAKDPDMQYALFTAQRDYARSGKLDLKMLLVDILIERTKVGNDDLKKIVLNEAIHVVSKLTPKQLNAISIRFLISYSGNF